MLKLLILLVLVVNMGIVDCQDDDTYDKHDFPERRVIGGIVGDYCPPGTTRSQDGRCEEEFDG